MSDDTHTTEEILYRLDILYKKLDDMGWYVSANTVELAIGEIKRLKVFEEQRLNENPFRHWTEEDWASFGIVKEKNFLSD